MRLQGQLIQEFLWAHGNEMRGVSPHLPPSPWNHSSNMTSWIYIPPSIFTNMFAQNLVCHDEMMANYAILYKVFFMKQHNFWIQYPRKHLPNSEMVGKNHSHLTWLSFFSIHCKGQSGIRRHVHRRHVHLSCKWQSARKLKYSLSSPCMTWLKSDYTKHDDVMQQQQLSIDFLVMSSGVDAFSNNCHHTLHINNMFCRRSVLVFIPSWVHSTKITTEISWQIEPLEVACLWLKGIFWAEKVGWLSC